MFYLQFVISFARRLQRNGPVVKRIQFVYDCLTWNDAFLIIMNSKDYQDRHNYILQNFVLCVEESAANNHYHDIDVIKEHHRFLWNDDQTIKEESWELRLARRYYNKLFKEYCIADLSRHKDNKVALRWRTKVEVITGRGQFHCGSRKCEERENLRTWEVNFAYKEHGERKNALVKLRLCCIHSDQLNYTSRKREIKRLKKSTNQQRQNMKLKVQNIKEMSPDDGEIAVSTPNDIRKELLDAKTHENESNIWCQKPDIEFEKSSRETDFERYLEDLLL